MKTSATPYMDDQGRPLLRDSLTAFLDVLGFSHTVVLAAKDSQSQECLDSISQALNESRAFVRSSLANSDLADPKLLTIKFFSDNLLVGYPCDTPATASRSAVFVLQCVQHYQLQMALSGHFVRGALTLGPLCVTEDIIFGTSLIESYQLESHASIVPRVVVTDAVTKLAGASLSASLNYQKLLCHDIDGWWFINYLQAAVGAEGVDWKKIQEHKASVMSSLVKTPKHDILPKFGWVSRYHNVFCHWYRNDPGYLDEYRIKRVDEESAILCWNDVHPGSN